MTSPSQLKYLDAIGIPVWVSRNLVVDLTKVPDEKKQKVENYVGNILHDLDEVKPAEPNSAAERQQSTTLHEMPQATSQSTTTVSVEGLKNNEIANTALHKVYACGDLQADWLVVGESPEFISNRENQPFADDSGVLLSNMLKAAGIETPRESAYLVNIIKSSVQIVPELEQQSSQALKSILLSTIEQIKPKLILVVGQIAAQRLLGSKEPLARLRRKQHFLPNTEIPLVVTYYPSYLLSKPLDKRKAWEDLQLAMSLLKK